VIWIDFIDRAHDPLDVRVCPVNVDDVVCVRHVMNSLPYVGVFNIVLIGNTRNY